MAAGSPKHRNWNRSQATNGQIFLRDWASIEISQEQAPNHEQIARFSLGEQFGHDATVGAGDEERPWRLAGGELLEQFPAARQDLALKFQETVDDILHAPLPANSAPLNEATNGPRFVAA
jgi:hypothetical protein